ncbi:H/ACA ribonucleoprotein complex subunit GAR1 [Methanocrinis sp.]|uniref:H/ACA ribonucleoprotein complex subunit GAR1 n=1 Tax=Methanocrinis sp. TaxID=3101522 RepID=UPI003D10AC21
MRRLGTTHHLVQKKLIVRGEPTSGGKKAAIPRINSVVVDHKKVGMGRVFDVFGPTDHPYIVVKPYRNVDAAAHLGKKLYFEERGFGGRNRKD